MKNILLNKKGTVFMIAVMISLLMVIIGVSLSNMITQDLHMVKHLRSSIQAQLLAESGLNDAIAILYNDGYSAINDGSNFPQTSLGAGTFDVSLVQSGGRDLLSCAGVVDNVSRTAAVEVSSAYPESLNRGLASDGYIYLQCSGKTTITVNGDIHSNDFMTLEAIPSKSYIDILSYGSMTGKATCTAGPFTTSGDVDIDDLANSGSGKPAIEMVTFNFGELKATAQSEGVYYSGNRTFNNQNLTGGSAGLIYVDGNVTFRRDCTITGGFVAAGDVSMQNTNTSVIQTQDGGNRFPVFLSNDQIDFKGYFSTNEGNILYARNSVWIRTAGGQTAVLGAVVSGGWVHVHPNNDVAITYFKVVATDVTASGIELISWNK